MTPLPPAPLTQEDFMIWRRVCGLAGYHAYFRMGCLETKGLLADRRDAALMFHIERSKIGTEDHWHKGAHSILRATILIGGDPGVAFTVRPW